MQQLTLKHIKHKIDTDQYYAVSVFSANGERIFINKLATEILEEYGSSDAFFKFLFSKYKSFKIQEKRKNGSAFKSPTGEGFFDSGLDNMAIPSNHVVSSENGLGTPSFGLSGHDVLRLSVSEIEARRLALELAELKPELKRLQQVERDFEIYKIQDNKSIEKSKSNTEMLQGIMQHLPAIGAALSGVLNKPQALGTPNNDDEFVRAYKALPSDGKKFFYRIFEAVNNYDEFLLEINTLLEKHTKK